MTYKFDKTVILGGGSSGWIVATTMCQYFPNIEITLIESPRIGTIGVGESTTAMMRQYIKYLNIDEKKFMQGTEAIYKASVKFNDFYKIDDGGFHYPLGTMDVNGLGTWAQEAWHLVKHFYPETKGSDFAKSFFAYETICEENKMTLNSDGRFGSSISPLTDTGYHFNANLVGNWLRDNWCKPKGVKHIQAEVKDVRKNENGVESLILDDGTEIFADFFIDCSGFRSVLLGKALQEEYISFEHKLPNNRAWAVPTEYKNKHVEMRPYTNTTALKNGWAWHTPIWSRVGNGYVYCDKYVDPENALKEFQNYLMSNKVPISLTKKEVENLPFFEIKMGAGKYKNTFVKNVCAIGLSSGFLEPLEGTGLFFVTQPSLVLAKILQRGKFTQYSIDLYNFEINRLYHRWLNLISIYYAYSLRDDSQYWKDISEKSFEPKMSDPHWYEMNGYFNFAYNSLKDHSASRLPENILMGPGDLDLALGAAMELTMDVSQPIIDRWSYWDQHDYSIEAAEFKNFFDARKEHWKNLAYKCQNNYEYLKEKIYQ